jgi:competence ComEA-like helix-hairpin-helix protein
MGLTTSFESRLGLTRGDVTVALFLSLAAFLGFIYTTFFEERETLLERRKLHALVERHDSILGVRNTERTVRTREVEAAVAVSDTATAWEPLTAADAAKDHREKAVREAASPGARERSSGPININTAGREALMDLPGVGEKTAEAIIEMRAHIPFRTPEDLMNVKGIGEKKFAKMKEFVRVR